MSNTSAEDHESQERLKAIKELAASLVEGTPEPRPTEARCAVAGGSGAGIVATSAEAHFLDRDLFLIYVEDEVNPARAAEGLDTVGRGAASHLYEILTSRRYLRPDGKHPNNVDHAHST